MRSPREALDAPERATASCWRYLLMFDRGCDIRAKAAGVLRSLAKYKALSTVEPQWFLGGSDLRALLVPYSARNQGAIGT